MWLVWVERDATNDSVWGWYARALEHQTACMVSRWIDVGRRRGTTVARRASDSDDEEGRNGSVHSPHAHMAGRVG